MFKKKIYLDNPDVLNCLNDYLPKKTASVLLGVSKIMKEYIVPKKYRHKMLLLDTSDLAKIKIFIDWNGMDCTFYEVFSNLKRFRYVTTRIHHWNNYHWAFLFTFVIYRYIRYSPLPFMDPYRLYISIDLDNFLEILLPIDITNVYNTCVQFPSRNMPELIML